mmetsp:Transcript_46251/g.108523  ORF Transcript_46251/g.108523 Transcript_46251/m.108523 type:complete len:191 (+) Transcript_46251:126-698(+)
MGPRDRGEFEELEHRYEVVKRLGQRPDGVVVAARDKISGLKVAVRVVKNAVEDEREGKRLLHQMALLRHFRGHENILSINDVIESPPGQSFRDIFLIGELMDADLHRVIRSSQRLTEEHVAFFAYQMLRGLKYIHSAGIIHGNLKPSNIMVNADCDLKISELDLAYGLRERDFDESRQWHRKLRPDCCAA